ncbi:hypothetical protein LTR62_008533 [Meristemomyces frigidus]|uniref:Uncharacterized protein n=1 Tax=Meristemomyces frigidus TaxID=1508187 RepID=A0AAN7YIL6_9PEZI|nr:hypothetical protein LTR62_008533 [Meristemomyces frigidus]
MLTLLTLVAFTATAAALAIAIAIPQGSGEIIPIVPADITVWYYAAGGWPNDDSMCLDHVANGTLTAGVCCCLDYPGVGVWQSPSNGCSLTVYEGTSVCGADATSTTVTNIPAGDSQICIDTDVNAGLKASGVWACS